MRVLLIHIAYAIRHECTHAQGESFYKQLYTHSHKLSASRSAEFWLLFRARAKGIMFYDVPVSYVKEELRFRCELEPFNAGNANSIRLNCPSTSRDRLQLT